MQVGILTAPFRNETMDVLARFAGEAGADAVEIDVRPGCRHLCVDFDDAAARDAIAQVRDAGVAVSALACYTDISDGDEAARASNQAALKRAVEMAAANDIEVVCCLAGLPAGALSREETITRIAAPFYRELAARAADLGVKLAMENWFATNIMHLDHWKQIFEEAPAENFGLNFDPSHLVWQHIDITRAVLNFASRFIHVHAKDARIDRANLDEVGTLANPLKYHTPKLPGLGDVDWSEFLSTLSDCGYDGPVCIEVEDRAYEGSLALRKEALRQSARYLRQFMPA